MDAITIEAAERAVGANYPAGLRRDPDRRARRPARAGRGGRCRGRGGSAETHGAVEMRIASDPADRAAVWRGRKAAFAAMGRVSPNYYVQDGVVPRTTLPQVLRRIDELSQGARTSRRQRLPRRRRQPPSARPLRRARSKERPRARRSSPNRILEACVDAGGSITGEHGVGADKACAMPLMFSETDLEAMKRLRARSTRRASRTPARSSRRRGCAARCLGRIARIHWSWRALPSDSENDRRARARRPDLSSSAQACGCARCRTRSLCTGSGFRSIRPAIRRSSSASRRPRRAAAATASGDARPRDRHHGHAPRRHARELRGKVVKNVAGYDLGKLFCGSRGRLGRVEQMALELHPRPETSRTVTTDATRWPSSSRSGLVPSAVDLAARACTSSSKGQRAQWTRRCTRSGQRAEPWEALRAVQSRLPGRRRWDGEKGAARPSRPADRLRRGPTGAALVAARRADRGGALQPELIADCVHCGFCLPTCPTYELWHEEMDSPRGRIQLMAGLTDGTLQLTDTVVEHFDRCLGCMACVPACPSGVQYDRLIESTRAYVEEHHRRGARRPPAALADLRRLPPSSAAPRSTRISEAACARAVRPASPDRPAVARQRVAVGADPRPRPARCGRRRLRAERRLRARQPRDCARARSRRLRRPRPLEAGLLRRTSRARRSRGRRRCAREEAGTRPERL